LKALKELIQSYNFLEVKGKTDIEVTGITADSRQVKSGWLFIAVKGTQTDGHQYIAKAIELGASVIVCETMPQQLSENVTYLNVTDAAEALGSLASAWYGNPSEALSLVGVTGTNGKTTTATLLYRLFRSLGYGAGLISTVTYCVNENEYPSTHTTPDPLTLNKLMAEMVEAGCSYCFMEVSSHSIVQKRIAGLRFKGALFTNITHDHLDYHKTFDNYIKAKKAFFDGLDSDAFALVNHDDRNGMVMLQNCNASRYTYALRTPADFSARILESHFHGMLLSVDGNELWTRFIGDFNAYNLLLVYSTAVLLGKDKTEILRILSDMPGVSGRFESLRSADGITAIVDYAHTPDALLNVLNTINEIRKGNEQLITVVGAGGNRDKTKRPEMAEIAVKNSDKVILTSDNPRNEEPQDILNDMIAGIPAGNKDKVLVLVDRHEAIRTACFMARPGDIILVAGKGHETYQEIKGVKHHFDDKEEIRKNFKNEATA
jgi:UDP-N-acetylmuramoyl-L-alanyl-D-glutamate--2,6-diaminopimelate ligase